MTRDEFIAILERETKASGQLWKPLGGMLRTDYSQNKTCRCPIAFVCRRLHPGTDPENGKWELVADYIGLSREDARDIVVAADCDSTETYELRRQLVRAMRLNPNDC